MFFFAELFLFRATFDSLEVQLLETSVVPLHVLIPMYKESSLLQVFENSGKNLEGNWRRSGNSVPISEERRVFRPRLNGPLLRSIETDSAGFENILIDLSRKSDDFITYGKILEVIVIYS